MTLKSPRFGAKAASSRISGRPLLAVSSPWPGVILRGWYRPLAAIPESGLITGIPQLGPVVKDSEFDWYRSNPIPVKVLGGRECRIVVEGYEQDEAQDDIHNAISDFLSIDKNVLKEAESHILAYYQDILRSVGAEVPDFPQITSPGEVWTHIQFGNEPIVSRRPYGDKRVYVSVECSCDWEPEHGLQIVFKNGRAVNKVGPYNGHFSNADAYADPSLEDVVYPQF